MVVEIAKSIATKLAVDVPILLCIDGDRDKREC
jgi:hypothetical protein